MSTSPEIYTVTCGAHTLAAEAFAGSSNGRIFLLSLIGSQNAVYRIRAALYDPLKIPTFRVKYGEPGDENPATLTQTYIPPSNVRGKWTCHARRLPRTKAWHAVFYPQFADDHRENAAKPEFLVLTRPQANPTHDPVEIHYQFLNRRVDLPLHHSWADWLWTQGLEQGEIVPLDSFGLQAWYCNWNINNLRALLESSVSAGKITVPEELSHPEIKAGQSQ